MNAKTAKRLNSSKKVKPVGHVHLKKSIALIAEKMFGDDWSKSPALKRVPFVQAKDALTKTPYFSRWYYNYDDDEPHTKKLTVAEKDIPEFKRLHDIQREVWRKFSSIAEKNVIGTISYKSGDVAEVGPAVSFFRTQYRPVYCSGFVMRPTIAGTDRGLVTIDMNLVWEHFDSVDQGQLAKTSNNDGSEKDVVDYIAIAIEFRREYEKHLKAEYGEKTTKWPVFTKQQAKDIITCVFQDGLKVDGSYDSVVAIARKAQHSRPKKPIIKYLELAFPSFALTLGGVGRRSTIGTQCAVVEMLRLGFDTVGSAGRVSTRSKSIKSN